MISVVRPRGRPPIVTWSKPGMPVASLGTPGTSITPIAGEPSTAARSDPLARDVLVSRWLIDYPRVRLAVPPQHLVQSQRLGHPAAVLEGPDHPAARAWLLTHDRRDTDHVDRLRLRRPGGDVHDADIGLHVARGAQVE